MNRISRLLLCGVAALLVAPSFAEDAPAKKKGKGKGKNQPASAMMMEKLSSLELTAEQKSKLEEVAAEYNETMASLKKEGYTAELLKKKADAMKKAREEGKKGKDLADDVLASLGLTDAEVAMLKKQAEAQTKFHKGIVATLTEEQVASLPEAVQTQIKRAAPKGKKNKAA